MPRRSFSASLLRSAILLVAAASLRADVTVAVDPAADRAPISPCVYGSNAIFPGVTFPLLRQGGNRMTGYNWENNASNAGSDYLQQSDNYLTSIFGVTGAPANVPGLVVTHFQDEALAAGTTFTLATLPMGGYVAADKNGPVAVADAAPSSRWVPVENNKPTALSLTPDTSDGKVYTDELLNFLVHRYGPASSATGIKAYDLDNEPDLWSSTHPRLHPAQPLCVELISRSVDMAKTVKRIDPTAEVVGFVSYGFEGYLSFQDAPDWPTGTYRWFVDYYLDQMKHASDTAGERLLDVLDLHNYSEAIGGGHRVNAYDYSDYTNLDWNKARLQAPRTYWDPTYLENSWIAQYNSSFLPFLPNIQQSIDTFYPGTKLAISEYSFGGEDHISGGIAEADTLGIFGKYGVYLAALWPSGNTHTYTIAAFKLYLDYDGAGGHFGDTSVRATNSDVATASVYAAAESGDPTRLHLIVLNKSYDTSTTFSLSVAGSVAFARARVFAFDSASATITERTAVNAIANNQFTYTLPALSAAHFVLEAPPVITTQPPAARTLETGRPLSLSVTAAGTGLTYQWRKDSAPIDGATFSSFAILSVSLPDAGSYDCVVTNSVGDTTTSATTVTVTPSPFAQQPASQAVVGGASATFTVTANAPVTYRWQRNGTDLAGADSATLALAAVQPADTGLYAAIIDGGSGAVSSDWALLGVQSAAKVVGDGVELQPTDIHHPNGNVFDQVLLTGAAETITCDYAQNQITRTSFLDPDGDIVQVEFAGPGTLSLVLTDASGPALAEKYNQDVTYMTGRAGLVITGADEHTNVSVFTVGRATAFDGTGHYNILLAPSDTNVPATNGSPLFVGHDSTDYDGIADLAFIAIASTNGKFGGLRAANARFSAAHGAAGIYAPGVAFLGPVFAGDISADGDATPVIILGSAADTRITGGDLAQANDQPVHVRGVTQLKFTAGSDSRGDILPAQANAAVLEQDGNDVTAEIVVDPAP